MEPAAAGERVARALTGRARAGGLQLTGEDGLVGKLAKMMIKGTLEAELTDVAPVGPAASSSGAACPSGKPEPGGRAAPMPRRP